MEYVKTRGETLPEAAILAYFNDCAGTCDARTTSWDIRLAPTQSPFIKDGGRSGGRRGSRSSWYLESQDSTFRCYRCKKFLIFLTFF